MPGPTGANYPSNGTIQYAPLLFSSKVMRIFTEACIGNEICNTDYEGDIKGKGDQVQVRVAPTYMNVGDYTPGVDINYEVPGEDARTLNIDQAKYVAFKLDDVDKVQSDLTLMNIFAERSANSAKIDTDTNILGYAAGKAAAENKGAAAGKVSGSYNLGATGAPVVITATNATDKIVDLGTVLSEYNVPEEGRYVVIPAWFGNFLKKSDLKAANITGDQKAVLRTGLIGEIDNFKVYRSNLVAYTDDVTHGSNVWHVLAGVKDAMTFASQINKSESVRNQNSFGDLWRLLLLYGREVIMPEALAELYCAPQ